MSSRLNERRARLRELYGFDFPEDFFLFWEFVNRLEPLEPLRALHEAVGITLVGPFEVLAGRFDGLTPRYSLLLHWRYRYDPPEFFTVLAGNTDGLHWGYYLDDPARASGCLAHYYARDAFELSADGDNLFEAVRLELEYHYRDCQDYRDDEPEYATRYEAALDQIDSLRATLQRYATADRPETGEEYAGRYTGVSSRQERVVARTAEGMGIVVLPGQYRPLSLKDGKLRAYLRKAKDPADVVEEARQALREGFPGTALKLGKELWAVDGRKKTVYTCELLDAAYAALGRDVLRRVLRTHRAHRNLPSVDILENE